LKFIWSFSLFTH